MDAFNIVDGAALALVAISAVLAYARGLVRETLSILGWVVAAVAAFAFAPAVGPLVREIPVLRDVIGGKLRAGRADGLRPGLRGGAGGGVDLHAAPVGGGAELGPGPVDQGWGWCSARCAAWC
jgi:hypothetical protein